MQAPDKHCELDPIPTFLLKKCASVLIPTITNIINQSLTSGTFPDNFKRSVIKPLLKKPTLDKEVLSNYRPISKLSFLSKLTEKIVKNRLTHHLSTNSLFNPHQSAYVKSHSTKTVLLALHDHLVQQTSTQQLTSSLSFSCIWHNWPYHSVASPQILVRNQWLSSKLDQNVPFLPKFCSFCTR